MTVEESIEKLRTLQTVDRGIRALEAELEELPRKLEAAQQDRAAVELNEKSAEEILDAVLKKRRDVEQDVAEADQNIIKFENDKLRVKTNVEFRALDTQIHTQKEIKSGLEDQVLLSFDEEEDAKEKVKTLVEELAMVSRTVDQRENDMKTRAVEDEKQLATLREQRTGIVEGIEKSMLSRYEAIRSGKGGVAVVVVTRNACGGCHTQQPPQKVNEIRKKNKLHVCDFCGRFLIWAVEETAAS